MKLTKGLRIRCRIQGKVVNDAKIQIENGKVYICQNIKSGKNCSDKLGYGYSWTVLSGSKEDCEANGVNAIRHYVKIKDRPRKKLSRKKKGNQKHYLVAESVYNKLFNAAKIYQERAKPFMLGRDKNYIIREAFLMGINGGCYAMPSITSSALSKAMIEIIKKNLIPCGLARAGHFHSGHDERGTIISQLRRMNKDAILLSFPSGGRSMTFEMPGEKKSNLKLYVVPDKIAKARSKGGE